MERNKKTITIALIVILVILAGIILYKYINYRSYCSSHFQKNTIINEIDCSSLTKDETIDKLTTAWNKNKFTITDGDKQMLVIDNLDFTYDIKDSVSETMADCARFPLFNRIFNRNDDLKIPMTADADNDNFEDSIDSLTIFDDSEDVKTKNAYLDMSNTNFKIVKEVYGTNIDKDYFTKTILKDISNNKWSIAYQEKDFYTQPTVKSDNEKLKEKQAYAKKNLNNIITYTFDGDKYVITPAKLDKLISVDDAGKVTVDNKQVKKFVAELASKYNTLGTDIIFHSTRRGNITVSGGTYGYSINQAKEVKQLTKDLKAMKNITREPKYSQKGWGRSNGGVGNTYVEVDISNQHLWYYQNGSAIISTDVVTGSVSGKTQTPTGAYYLVYKSVDAKLKGQNADGSDYETPVDYWMPFYLGYGMHDANWRGSFGGTIYKTGGSHGCVNMPPSQAGKLFNSISQGCPVIVHY